MSCYLTAADVDCTWQGLGVGERPWVGIRRWLHGLRNRVGINGIHEGARGSEWDTGIAVQQSNKGNRDLCRCWKQCSPPTSKGYYKQSATAACSRLQEVVKILEGTARLFVGIWMPLPGQLAIRALNVFQGGIAGHIKHSAGFSLRKTVAK